MGSTYAWEDYAYREGELLGAALLGFVGLYLFTYALTLPIYFGLRYLLGA